METIKFLNLCRERLFVTGDLSARACGEPNNEKKKLNTSCTSKESLINVL